MIKDRYARKYYRNPRGLLAYRYNAMKERSKRWHFPFKLRRGEFVAWLYQNGLAKMYNQWRESGFERRLAPSIDRIDPSRGYTLDNMRLVTWKFNIDYSNAPRKRTVECVETNTIYRSLAEASKATGVSVYNISSVCNKRRKKAGGYHWKFV